MGLVIYGGGRPKLFDQFRGDLARRRHATRVFELEDRLHRRGAGDAVRLDRKSKLDESVLSAHRQVRRLFAGVAAQQISDWVS
jgi:hypothetical protein